MSTTEIITRTSVIQRDALGIIRAGFTLPEETLSDARENLDAVRAWYGSGGFC